MSLFDRLGGANQMSPADMLQKAIEQAKANYMTILQQKGLNIPHGMTDPQQISNYLVSSGQVPQSRLAWAKQKLGWR